MEFVQAGANEHLLRQVREDDMKSSATPQDTVRENDGQQGEQRGRQQSSRIGKDVSVKTEVLRLIQVARPCLGGPWK